MGRHLVRTGTAVLAVCSILASPQLGWAQAAPAQAASPAGEVERARLHYERGIQLYNEENYDAALYEFERAYELAPSFKILYNMARIQRQQNNYAAALQNFRRYLTEGGANVPEERRKEVDREIDLLKPRVATIDIKVNVDGADVYLDDSPVCTGVQTGCVGKSPLPGPMTVNPGRRKISAQKRGYSPASTVVRVVGSDAANVSLELVSLAQRERQVDNGPRNRAIIAWSATGAVAIGATVFGILALSAQSKLKTDRDSLNIDFSTLDSDARRLKTYAAVTDVLGGVAIVGAVISTYFTINAVNAASVDAEKQKQERTGVSFDVGPRGAVMLGKF